MHNIEKNYFMRYIACLVSLGGILYGYDMGVISGALLFITHTIPMNDTQVGLVVGAVLGGGLIGTLLAGPIADRWGRRFLIGVASILFIVGVVFILGAHTFVGILLARICLGIGVGIIAVAVPLYVSEIVPSKDRGKYVTFFQLLLTFGILLAYFVDLLFTPSQNWRGMFAVLLVPAIILLIGTFFLPETPRWLIANKKELHAKRILEKIRSFPNTVEEEIQIIQAGLQQSHGRWRELFSKNVWIPSMIAVAVAIFNQLCGINSFLQYAPLILKNSGVDSDLISMIGSVGIGMLNFLFTLIAITLIDSLGRRPLLLVGIVGVIVSEVFLGCVNYFFSDSSNAGMLSLMGLLCFIMFFAVGPGVVVWLVISELFPTRIRGKGIAICLFFNSLASTMLATFFLSLVKHLGVAQTYWLFALLSVGYLAVAYYLLPETRAKSLEEIQHYFVRQHE